MQHDFDFVFLDSEREQGADEHSHSIDAVHMQNLAEIASDDASLGTDFLDRANRFHGIGHGLIQAWDHRLAISPDVNAEFGKLHHFFQQQLVEFKQRVVQRGPDPEFPGFLG